MHLAEIRKATTALKNVVDFMRFLLQAKMMIFKAFSQRKNFFEREK